MTDILGGTVSDPETGKTGRYDLRIENGVIAEMAESGTLPATRMSGRPAAALRARATAARLIRAARSANPNWERQKLLAL